MPEATSLQKTHTILWQQFRSLVEAGHAAPLKELLAQCRAQVESGHKVVMVHRFQDAQGGLMEHPVRTFASATDLEKLQQDIERALRIARDFPSESA